MGGKFALNEAPEPLRRMLLEAHEFTRSACGANAVRGQYPVFFQSTSLPALPLAVADFNNADAKAYISADTATFSNRVAADVMEGKRVAQQRAQEGAVAARLEQSKRDRVAFAAKFNAVDMPRMEPLYTNPFALEGKVILVRGYFRSMESRTTALFSASAYGLSDYAGTILVTDVPVELVGEPVDTLLAVKVTGQVNLENANAGKAPTVKYLGHMKCSPERREVLACS